MNTVRTARLAFVGAGNHATGSLYPNLAQIPAFDFVALCDLDESKARRTARKFGAPEWFTDVAHMLDRAAPEGVCVCGSPEMHQSVGLQVVERGLPVFVEKPPALTLREARLLADAARENGTWGMVGFMKRFAPANVVAKEFMDTSDFGELSSLTLIHGSGPYDDMRRMLLFNGIHMLDLARWLAGEVESLFAHGRTDGVQAASVAMQFADGAVGQFNMNSGHTWSDCFEQTYLAGSGAAILIDASQQTEVMAESRRFANGEGLSLYGWGSRYYVSGNMAGWEAGGHYTRGYWGELNHFARAVLGEVEPAPTLADGVEAMRLIEAIMRSIESGQPVALAEKDA